MRHAPDIDEQSEVLAPIGPEDTLYLSYDQRPHYEYLKTVLKALVWQHGPDRWILKSPQHMEHLPALIAAFPDATVALTHRDPVSVITSAITMPSLLF